MNTQPTPDTPRPRTGLALGWVLSLIGYAVAMLLYAGWVGPSDAFLLWSALALPLGAAQIVYASRLGPSNSRPAIAAALLFWVGLIILALSGIDHGSSGSGIVAGVYLAFPPAIVTAALVDLARGYVRARGVHGAV